MGANPPINTKETNPLQGICIIDQYNLGQYIENLCNNTEASVDEILDEINGKYISEEMQPISRSALYRWIKKHITGRDLRIKDDEVVNIYGEELELLNGISEQIQNIEINIYNITRLSKKSNDMVRLIKEHRDLSFIYDKLVARKQALLANIKKTQEKIKGYINVTNFTTALLQAVSEEDLTVYANVMNKLNKDPMYKELCRKIRPVKDDKIQQNNIGE